MEHDQIKVKKGSHVSQPPDVKSGPVQFNTSTHQSPQMQHYRNLGNQAIQRMMESGAIQAKLKIGQPNDKYEQEADRVADQVMRMPEESLVNGHWSLVQQQDTCPECMEEEEEVIQTKPMTDQITPLVNLRTNQGKNHTPEVTSNIESGINSLKGGGQPLFESTLAFFEPRFGHDFSQVRIHTGDQAAKLANKYKARAFTYKNNIVFNQGEYAPHHPIGQKLLAHEMVHVVQQQGGNIVARNNAVTVKSPTAAITSTPAYIARTAREDLEEEIARIDNLLSYGVFDWAITDADATEAMRILRGMSNTDRTIALRQINIDRLRSNIPDQYRLELAVMLIAGQTTETVLEQIRELLSYSIFDWVITDEEAEHVFNMLTTLSHTDRDQVLAAMGRFYRRRLYENLTSDEMKEQFMRWWDERTERIVQEQVERLRPPEPEPRSEGTPIEQKYREFQEWMYRADIEEEESPIQPMEERGPLPSRQFIEIEARIRYYRWIEREQDSPEYLTLEPADLYGRIYGQILDEYISRHHAEEELRERIEKEGQRSLVRWNEFQDFIRNRLDYIGEANATEARIQEQLLREFIQWTAVHQNTPEFQTASPIEIYEQIAQRIITPEMDRERIRAESSPQTDEARQEKLDEFIALANQLRSFRDQFPGLVEVPSQGRDILIHGSPAIQYALDAMAAELTNWAIRHYNDGDFTTQSCRSVLLTIVRGNEREYQAVQLMPWLSESIIRTDLDAEILARSFASSLGQVLLGSAIVGIVVGAEILTLGQVTWILLAFAAGFGVDAFLERRAEIEETHIDVPVAETVVHSAGDVIGLSRVIEGATGFRLGTEQQLNSVQRTESLGSGSGQLVGVFLASRSYRAGLSRGAAWRQRLGSSPSGPPPSSSLLPGPQEHFPFGGQGEPFPIPERPNCVYRIMGLAEAAEALRTNRLPQSVTGTSGQKYFSLDSRYSMLFRERNLAQVQRLGQRIQSMEANLAQLEARMAEVRAEGNTARLAELEVSRARLMNRIAEESARTREQAQGLIEEWYYNPDQSVVVEIELAPGALDHIFSRAVHQRFIGQYEGQNVYIWLVERGYGRNIAVPPWQIEYFNRNFVRAVRLQSTRAPLGQRGLSADPGHSVAPTGDN